MIPHHYLTKPGLPGFAKSSRFDLPSLLEKTGIIHLKK